MSQLGLGLGLSNVSSLLRFSPLDLDPYLLFDTQSSMIGTLENPTLDLDPANPETLDVITASRAGVATYTDADGLIQSASPNTTRVDYTQGAELTPTKFQRVPYSTPDSNWTTVNSTLVEDFGVAPDDTQSASKATKLAVGGSSSANDRVRYSSIAIANGTTYSVSVHLKNIDVTGFTTIAARVSGGSLFRVKFIWNTSALSSDSGTTSNRLVEDLGDGWYRVSFSFESNGAAATLEIDIDRSTGGREDTSSILVWGAQLEEGTTASSFVANTTGNPKFISSAVYSDRVPMVLIEPSAINLITYSEDFENTGWTAQAGITLTSNTTETLSPEGLNNSYKVVSADNTKGFFYGGGYISITSAATRSIFLKGAEGGETITFKDPSGHGTPIVHTLTTEWVRYEMSTTNDGNTYQGLFIDNISVGTIYAWGAQVETGSVATSYIPTAGGDAAARTRAADDLEITGSAFSGFFNGTEGTIYAEFVPKRNDDYRHVYEFSNGGTGQRINLHLHDVRAYFYSQSNGATYQYSNNPAAGATTGVLHRSAFSYKTNDAPASFDGGAEIPDTEYSVPSGINRLYLGDYTPRDGNYILNGHIKRLIYWPYHSDSL
jgi:hypothetical protein